MNNYPKSRKTNIVVQEFENEVLIYDLSINKAFCLNQSAALVYQFSDGTKSVSEINDLMNLKLQSFVGEDLIFLALTDLEKANLIERDSNKYNPHLVLSRREAVRKAGLVSLVALPVVMSIVAPSAALAASCGNTSSNVNNCGTCGNVCNLPNATPACVSGTCQIASCNAGFANCNSFAPDGCETNTDNDRLNCGGCGVVCSSGLVCSSGQCVS